ncbi:MFS transporter [Rickettsiella endosymbiont of Litargus connexus]|jgi:MFS transporter, DHA1 family, staphyloferrin B biosynthesis exporter|uniref:MFS transporter n=1 Tax=Rickettsiella endosymbiont of Litargus connexus TaxID=3066237 RepID=UPI00376EDBAD
MSNLKGYSWRNQINLIIVAQFIVIAVLGMSDPYWPLILASFNSFEATTLQYWSGAIYMAPLLAIIFTTLFWVKIGERIGYKKMILRAGFALAASQWALIFFHKPLLVFLIRLIQGAFAGFTTATQVWSLSIAPINVHSQIVGRIQAATAGGTIVGPVCGGILANYFGYLSIFITAGFTCLLISIGLIYFLEETRNKQSLKGKLTKIKKICANERFLLSLICLTQIAKWMSKPFFALYVAKQLHASTLTLGLIYALIALAMSLTTPSVGWIVDRKSPRFVFTKSALIISFLLCGAVQWCYAYISHAYWAFILSIVLGISLGIIALLLFSFLLKGAEESSRGKLVGLANTTLKIGNLFGIIIGTIVQAQYNFFISFLSIGSCYFALAVLTTRFKQTN